MTDPARARMSRPRYQGIASFFRTAMADGPQGLDIALMGVPYDGAVTNRPGTRHGPRAVRDASTLMRLANGATGVCPHDLATIADIGDVFVDRPYDIGEAHAAIERAFDGIVAAGAVPVTCGGDHSISLPILRAVGRERPVGMIHIDAHADTGDDYLGSRWHHGTPFRRAVEAGGLDPARTIQIGVRGTVNEPDVWNFSLESGMRLIPMDEFEAMGVEAAVAEARAMIGDGPVYLSFDIDSLDPVWAPGTGTPEAGGLTMREALKLIRGLRGLNLAGADMVEVSPPFDVGGLTALHGATILFELLCLAAEAVAARKAG